MYGTLRAKRGFQTRRKKERPSSLPMTCVENDGTESRHDVPINIVPTTYLALELPPPGLLTGARPTTMNPELKVHLKGDTGEVARAIKTLGVQSLAPPGEALWGPFCRMLAKIAHSFAWATAGNVGYQPLLSDIVRGRSLHLSHFVGGTGENVSQGSELEATMLPITGATYLVVTMRLLGGRLPPYQAVAGLVGNPEEVINEVLRRRAAGA